MQKDIDAPTLDRLQRRILENMSTAIVVLDQNLDVVYVSPACEMLFEISRRKARGLSWNQLVLEPEALTERLYNAIKQGHPFTEREVHLGLFGNRVLTIDISVTPLYEPMEKPGLLIELQHVDRQLRISKEENLISQNQAVRALIRGLAHEIKNPLGGLRGSAQLLERELHDEDLKEYTQIIIEEADRLQNLVNRMLGPNTLPKKTILNIHQVLERVRNLVSIDKPKGITIGRDYDPSIPEIEADQDQLIQAILNLVRNAIQALETEGVIILRTRAKRQFTIGQQRYKLVIMIEVVDNGPGIPPEMLDRVFLPMITGRADGSGLGLSIAQSLINRHGGLIECTSKPGKTVFRILLPLEKEDE